MTYRFIPAMSQPHIIFSVKNVAENMRIDKRTAISRIARLQIEPFAITPDGTAFYLGDVVPQLQADALGVDVTREAESH